MGHREALLLLAVSYKRVSSVYKGDGNTTVLGEKALTTTGVPGLIIVLFFFVGHLGIVRF